MRLHFNLERSIRDFANAYACVASVNRNIFGDDRKKLRETASEMRSEFANDAFCVSNRKCTTENETRVKPAIQ